MRSSDVDNITSLDVDESTDIDTCLQMLKMLDGQIADLEHAAQTMRTMRAKWCARLGITTALEPTAKARAPRGSIKFSVLSELSQNPDGLTLSELDSKLSAKVGTFSRQSLKLALSRLKKEGRVTHGGNRWHIASDGASPFT